MFGHLDIFGPFQCFEPLCGNSGHMSRNKGQTALIIHCCSTPELFLGNNGDPIYTTWLLFHWVLSKGVLMLVADGFLPSLPDEWQPSRLGRQLVITVWMALCFALEGFLKKKETC